MDREESSVSVAMEMDSMHERLAGGQSEIDLKELGEKLRSKSGKEVSNFIEIIIHDYENLTVFSSIRILLSSDCRQKQTRRNSSRIISRKSSCLF